MVGNSHPHIIKHHNPMKKITKTILVLMVLVFYSFEGIAQSLPGDSIVFGPMFSPVYGDSVRVWVLTKDNTGSGNTLNLKLTAASSPGVALTGVVHNTDSRLGYHLRSFKYGGLTQGETYEAVVLLNGANSSRRSSLKNQSIGFNDFSFLAGGCGRIYDTTRCIDIPESYTHINGTPEIFNQMATEDSDMMVWLGDAVYLLGLQHAMGQCPNGVDDWANKDMAFDRYMFYRQFHDSLTKAMPQLAITDNHDTGPNEFDKTMPTLGAMKEIFMDWWPNPEYKSTVEGQGLFSSYVYNDVEFFLTDNRSYRTGTQAHFGNDQQEWLKQGLLNSTATFKIIISGTPVFNPWGGRNYVVSQQGIELRQFIQDNNISGVLAYDADIHRQEFYGGYQNDYPLFDVMSGNLNSDVGNNPSYSINYNDDKLMGGVKQTYVKTYVEGDSADRRIRIQYRDELGSPYFEAIIHSDMLVSEQDSVKKVGLSFSNSFLDSAEGRTISNTAVTFGADKDGNANSAAVFNGTAQLSTVHTTNLNMHDRAFSASYWVNPSSFGSNGSVVLSKGSSNTGFSIGFDEEGYPTYTDHATGVSYSSTRKLLRNKWAHIAWIYDNVKRQLKLYFNGQQIELFTGVISSVASSDDLLIGANYGGNNFQGALDEVELYGKLITVESIQQIAGIESAAGSALQLDGSQNMHIPGSIVNPILSYDFTLELWARFNGDPCTNCKLLSSNGRVNGNSTGLSFEFSDQNKLNMVFGNNTGGWNAQTNLGSSWNIGEWNHIALSFTQNDTAKIYINGKEMAKMQVGTYVPNSWGLGLGDSPAYGSEVQADIDQLRIWNIALPQDSIVKRMHYGLSGMEAGLQLNYDFSGHTDTTFISNGAVSHEVELDGGTLVSSTAPLAYISNNYRTQVTANWSVENKSNSGLALIDPVGDYITNLVVGRNMDSNFTVLDTAANMYMAMGGWQLEQSNMPFANIRLNLSEALARHDSIIGVASAYYLVHEDSSGHFSNVNSGSFDGQNVSFFNTYIEGGHYFLAWSADSSGTIGRGGALSLNNGHNISIPYQDVDAILTGAFTIETWFRLMQDPGNNTPLISTHGRVNGNTTGLSFEFPSDNSLNVVFGTNTGGWNAANTNQTFTVGEWNHLAVTVTPNDSFHIYVNGELANSQAFAGYVTNSNWNLAFGKSINYGGQLIAEMDEFRIWGEAKSAAAIKDEMHLSLDGSQSNLWHNYTFNQRDFGYLLNQVATPDSISFSNASLVEATSAVSQIDPAYQNTVRGSWSAGASSDNGLYVSSTISAYTSNVVIGKSQNNQMLDLAGAVDTMYLAGGWLLNPMNLDTADLELDLSNVLASADSLSKFAVEYYLILGDPQSTYEIVATGNASNHIVSFDDVPLSLGEYRLAWKADVTKAISELGGALSLATGHNVTISKNNVNPVFSNPNGFTLETWFRLNQSTGNNTPLISTHGRVNGNTTGLSIEFPSSNSLNIVFGTNTGGWNAANTNASYGLGEWNHLALAVAPNDSFYVYVNGERTNSKEFGAYAMNTNWDLAFGKSINYGGEAIVDIDEFRLYNRVKTAAQVKADMYKELSSTMDTSLKINYSFNEGNNGYIQNTGAINDSSIYANASVVPATDPVRIFASPYDTLMGASWSSMQDAHNGFYVGSSIDKSFRNVVSGREAIYSIDTLAGTLDTFYLEGPWLVDPASMADEVSINVDLTKLFADPDSITEDAGAFFLLKGALNGSYTFAAEGMAVGDVVEFNNVKLDSALYTLAWRIDTGVVPVIDAFPILTGNDDAEQDISNGSMYLTSSDLEITLDGSSEQAIGLRFDNITIPQGSVINSAYIQFTVDEVTTSGTVDAVIAIEEGVDPLQMNSFAYNLSSRTPFYGDSLVWNIPAFDNVDDAGVAQRTPDLSSLLSYTINKQDWESGNAVLFMMADPAVVGIPGYTGNTGKRTARSYESDPAKAPKLVVSYIKPERYYNGTFPIAKGSSWLYDTTGQSLDAVSWKDLGYNDSTWAYGDAILGYGDGNETTTLSYGPDASNKYPTYYLRHKFEVDDASKYDSLVFKVLRDDGVVVYVNGVEAFRQNMPTGAVTYSTYASSAVGGSDETTYFETVTAKMLQTGTNVIAVELHQQSGTSSDLSFDMEVGYTEPPLAPASYPFAAGETWHYLDNGSDLDTVAWKDTTYNDYSWEMGKAPLGYGDPVTTIMAYGPDASNKYITTYLRRDVMIDTLDPALGDTLIFGLRRDDGAVVYLNGSELFRSNMPSGTITNQTTASNAVSGSDETDFFTYKFHKSIFEQGRNQIAVELHQANATSSDLVFDFYIENAPVINPPALGCAGGNGEHIACFQSIAPTGQTGNLLIPTGSHKFQMLFKQGEPYSVGGGNVPGNADFTGYVAMNGSSELGHLSVNHENTPGGVSMLDVHYNDSSNLWVVDTSQAVDFYNNDLVTTTRNCSGGITPWGTVVTAEESTNGGDVNNDGYEDVGWLVEIDPITAKVVDYNNDGVQDKLWAMGRMNHENVVISNDSTTAYYGEDGGTHCVYKYVMDTPGDLSSGTVYVLGLNQPLINDDPSGSTAAWIQVPNTTQSDRNNLNTVAASLGGTNFNGVEDVEISPIDGKVYFTAKGRNRVYRFTDNGNTASNFETFVGGTSYILNTEQGVYTEAWGSGNDNLAFDDQGNLWVLQDGGNNYIWVVRPDHSQSSPKVELFASMPAGSEPTGLTFTPDYRFGFFSVQHPSGSNPSQLDATGNSVSFNASATIVFSREKWLGAQKPIAGFEADTTVVILGGSIAYADTSMNNPTSWEWTFNGGTPATSTNTSEIVTYNGLGFYTTQLVVANLAGEDTAVYTQYIEVIEPAPVADFVANKTQLIAGDSVVFTSLSTNNPDSLYWSFAGGSPLSSDSTAPVITYNTPGLYDVTLMAYNRAGVSAPSTKVQYIEVMSPAPVADFVASATQVMVGDSVTFTDLSTNDPDTWNWIFSGGAPSVSTDSMPTVTYNSPGLYDVTLITSNATGSSSPNVKVSYIEVVDNTSLSETGLAEVVDIYPNPTSGSVTLEMDLSGGENVVVELYDLRARKLADLANTTSKSGKQKWVFELDKYVGESQALIIKIQVDQQVTTKVVRLMH